MHQKHPNCTTYVLQFFAPKPMSFITTLVTVRTNVSRFGRDVILELWILKLEICVVRILVIILWRMEIFSTKVCFGKMHKEMIYFSTLWHKGNSFYFSKVFIITLYNTSWFSYLWLFLYDWPIEYKFLTSANKSCVIQLKQNQLKIAFNLQSNRAHSCLEASCSFSAVADYGLKMHVTIAHNLKYFGRKTGNWHVFSTRERFVSVPSSFPGRAKKHEDDKADFKRSKNNVQWIWVRAKTSSLKRLYKRFIIV